MRKGLLTASAIAGALVGGMLTIGVAAAQTDQAPAASETSAAPAKPAMKPKPKKPAMASVSVTIANKRSVGLTDLQAGESGTGKTKKIAGPLAAGKKTVVSLTHGKDCLFDLSAVYDDGSTMDAAGVDLCADKTINLVD